MSRMFWLLFLIIMIETLAVMVIVNSYIVSFAANGNLFIRVICKCCAVHLLSRVCHTRRFYSYSHTGYLVVAIVSRHDTQPFPPSLPPTVRASLYVCVTVCTSPEYYYGKLIHFASSFT